MIIPNKLKQAIIGEKELSRARFDEQGVLYTYDHKVLIKCPDKLEYVTIHPKTKIIANYAFVGSRIKNIKMPESLEIIGHHAFYAASLEYIDIPDSVHTIGHDAFGWCQLLNKISLPSELIELQESTFQKCRCLETVVIPSSVKTIGGGCFSGCFKIKLKIKNLDFKVSDDCLYQLSKKSLISCWSLKKKKCLAKGLLRVENKSFAACKHFDSIRIPKSVKYIGNNLFGDYGVSAFFIPDSVETIEPFAFDHNVENIYVQPGQSERIKSMIPSTYHKIICEIQ